MSRQTSYSPQIDTLRALAILVVMLHHYINGPFLLAGFGVVMFFLLSGYFGTRGLMGLRAKLEARTVKPHQALGTFYQRRYARIVPLYWLVIACAAVGGVEYARDALFWNALFLSNVAILRSNEWMGRFSQLWSLGVLEQFYLVWPAAILFLPKRLLVPLSVLGIGTALGWRIVCDQAILSPLAWTSFAQERSWLFALKPSVRWPGKFSLAPAASRLCSSARSWPRERSTSKRSIARSTCRWLPRSASRGSWKARDGSTAVGLAGS